MKMGLKGMSFIDIFMGTFKKGQYFFFTSIIQNQDCVTGNYVNLFQSNINDDVLPLVFYEKCTTQWLFHEEYKKDSCKYAHTGFYNTNHNFYEY
jgi:hypothetical protein